MSNHSPITPPNGLLDHCCAVGMAGNWYNALTIAYQAGADQELEACCELVPGLTNYLRAARRPKPPSLKEQALSEVAGAVAGGNITPERGATIRLALEQLND